MNGNMDYDIDFDSNEDTEDASETESMKYQNDDGFGNRDPLINRSNNDESDSDYEIKEQIFREKLGQLQNELIQLEQRIHPEYIRKQKVLQAKFLDRIDYIKCFSDLEKRFIESDYQREMAAIEKEYQDRKDELRENLIAEVEEKRRLNETDPNLDNINGDTSEPKTLTTRKLRRRPNDPTPMPNDRRRRTSPAQINLLLKEQEIEEDLKIIKKILRQP